LRLAQRRAVSLIWVICLGIGLLSVGPELTSAATAPASDCKLGPFRLRLARALEVKELYREALAEYRRVLETAEKCVLTEAIEGYVRVATNQREREVRAAQQYLQLGRRLAAEGVFSDAKTYADAKAYLDKGNTPDTRSEAVVALLELHRQQNQITALVGRRLNEVGPYLIWPSIAIVVLLGLRAVSLCLRSPMVLPLSDMSSGTTGRLFAETVEAVAREITSAPHRPLVAPTLILVDRSESLPDLSTKVGGVDVKGLTPLLTRLVAPSRHVIEGNIVSVGREVQANVTLRRTRYLWTGHTLAYWIFRFPAEDGEMKMRSIRRSVYTVLFKLRS
jgi:hypothetical protein